MEGTSNMPFTPSRHRSRHCAVSKAKAAPGDSDSGSWGKICTYISPIWRRWEERSQGMYGYICAHCRSLPTDYTCRRIGPQLGVGRIDASPSPLPTASFLIFGLFRRGCSLLRSAAPVLSAVQVLLIATMSLYLAVRP